MGGLTMTPQEGSLHPQRGSDRALQARVALALMLSLAADGSLAQALSEVTASVPAASRSDSAVRLRMVSSCETCLKREQYAFLDGPASVLVQTTDAPLGLDALVDLSIQNHPSVNARRAELAAATADVDTARQSFYPSPSAQLQGGHGDSGTVIAVQQPLWTGGRLTAALNAADSRMHSTDVSIAEAQYALAIRVATAYQSWLQANGRIEVLARSVTQLESYLERTDRRIAGGASAEVDRQLVEARLAQAQSDYASARSAERNALTQLSQISGRTLATADLLPVPANADVSALPTLGVLNDQALRNNPTVNRFDYDIQAARFDADQRRAQLFPTISLRAEHQRGTPLGGVSSTDNRLFVVLEYTPGAGRSAAAQIEAGNARIESQRASQEAYKRDLSAQLALEYEDYLTSLARKKELEGTRNATAEVLASYDRLFIAGKRGWLDVLNEARELTQVELNAADILPQITAGRYRLRLLSGEQPWQRREPLSVRRAQVARSGASAVSTALINSADTATSVNATASADSANAARIGSQP